MVRQLGGCETKAEAGRSPGSPSQEDETRLCRKNAPTFEGKVRIDRKTLWLSIYSFIAFVIVYEV